MTLTSILASAWAAEREKYEISWIDQHGQIYYAVFLKDADEPCWRPASVDEDMIGYTECQAHLDSLCAAAQERALAEAGYVCVPREPTEAMCAEGRYAGHGATAADIYRAMIAAAG